MMANQFPEINNSAVKEFLERYDNEIRNHYAIYLNEAESKCKKELGSHGVPFMCQSRVKTKPSLAAKLKDHLNNETKKPLTNESTIKDAIRDIAGLRFVLYKKRDFETVDAMIKQNFKVEKTVLHPRPKSAKAEDDSDQNKFLHQKSTYEKQFEGYSALHYQVKLRHLKIDQDGGEFVEIQITSFLRHLWAAIEHDVLYKHLNGEPSEAEKTILDSLDGLLKAGDILIEHLSQTTQEKLKILRESKKPFEGDLQLARVIYDWLYSQDISYHDGDSTRALIKQKGDDPTKSTGLTALRRLLEVEQVGLETPSKLRKVLESIDFHNFSQTIQSAARDLSKLTDSRQADPCGLNVSICIMNEVLTRHGMVKEHGIDGEKLAIHQLKVICSTMLWLDELFRDLPDLETRIFEDITKDTKKQLQWLFLNSERSLILFGDQEPSHEGFDSWGNIEGLWKWLSVHEDNTVITSFKLARIGVLKDFPNDVGDLAVLRAKWGYFYET